MCVGVWVGACIHLCVCVCSDHGPGLSQRSAPSSGNSGVHMCAVCTRVWACSRSLPARIKKKCEQRERRTSQPTADKHPIPLRVPALCLMIKTKERAKKSDERANNPLTSIPYFFKSMVSTSRQELREGMLAIMWI